eukprot:TRINITY_DN930_c0_g1_i8.p1 TRINITY_DN930_c0_g1~~TRINITY_DN930_c0_g1_i8.p1  ORF type:complete len:144 (+),score=17.99 TRINITY_DN930_c0_g1_i8:121-552(+)
MEMAVAASPRFAYTCSQFLQVPPHNTLRVRLRMTCLKQAWNIFPASNCVSTAPSVALPFTSRKRKPSPSAFFGDEGSGKKTEERKKFITKEEEPEQYWQTKAEREGVNPMLTPLPYIAIFGLLTPFIILGIAFANGWIKMPAR